MKKVFALFSLVIILIITANGASADESVTVTPMADKTQIARMEWLEKINKCIFTTGFADLYRNGQYFGKARVFYGIGNDISLGSETRFTSQGAINYFGPQIRIKSGDFTTYLRYWVAPNKKPDIGTYTQIKIGNKLWLNATINFDDQKVLLLEPGIGYKLDDQSSLFLQYRAGSVWKNPELQLGLQIKF